MNKPTIKSLTEQLAEEKRLRRQAEDANISLQSKIAGSPTLQDKLNTANATVAELMEQNDKLIKSNDLHVAENLELCKEVEKLKSDYALLEEKYYTQADNYTELNKMHDDLLSKFNKNLDQHRAIEAENNALKAEIEHYKDVIETKRAEIKRFVEAENQLNKEQQPTVINYHNCTFNN